MYTYMVIWVNMLFYFVLITGNMYFFFFYWLKHDFFEKYKSVDEPWPWEGDKKDWNKLFWRSIMFTTFNSTVVPFLLSYPSCMNDTPIPFRVDENFTSPFTMLVQILFCNMVENISFYFSHLLLHQPFFYKRIHKIHHEHKVTISLSTIHTHPIEYFLGNAVPSSLGCLILG